MIYGPIAVVAPCHAYDPAKLEAGLTLARRAGFTLELLPDLLQPYRYFAAPPAHRAAQLIQALTDPRYGAVWLVRGGSGMMQLLPALEGVALRSDRPVIGFSDATALFAVLDRRNAGPIVHGPVLHSLASTERADVAELFALLRSGVEPIRWQGATLVSGHSEGPIVGGNLSLVASLCGTPHQIDAKGRILLLEEVGEPAFRIERMLTQLALAGVFDGAVGIGLGDLGDVPSGADYRMHDVVMDTLKPLNIPVLANLPFGHRTRNQPFVWNARASIDDGELRITSPSLLA
ncbi:MAG: LD-carboxypeptidase [Myxococcota bacterium]